MTRTTTSYFSTTHAAADVNSSASNRSNLWVTDQNQIYISG